MQSINYIKADQNFSVHGLFSLMTDNSDKKTKKIPRIEKPDLVEIIRLYGPDIRKSIRRRALKLRDVLDDTHLDDIEQNVYEKILKGCLDTFEGRASLKNYLCYYVVKSVFKDYIDANLDRIKEADENFEMLSDFMQMKRGYSDTVSSAADAESLHILIKQTIGKMSQHKQNIYRLIIEENLPQVEISAKLGIKQPTVSEHWSRIRAELKDEIKKKFPGLISGYNRGAQNGQKVH